MFAKVLIFCAAVAAAHASLVGPYGLGVAPLAAVGPYGYGLGRGLIGAPAVALGASQSAVINHVAPVAAYGGLYAGHGLAAPLLGGPYGLGVAKVAGPGVYGLGLGKAIW